AKLQPPHAQGRETPRADAGEGRAVVAADRLRQTVVFEHRLHGCAGVCIAWPGMAIAAEHHAAETIRDRQRVALAAVAKSELPFVVDAPHAVRSRVVGGTALSSVQATAATTRFDQPGVFQ